MRRIRHAGTIALATVSMALAQGFGGAYTKDIRDADIGAGDTVTFSRDTVYILRDKVFVENTAVLNIKAGTVIKGGVGATDDATALIICRGAKINANGTRYNPIIMTALSDNGGNLTTADKGLWGGLVILGAAQTNQVEDNIEGISPTEPRGLYGGSNDNDSSGVLRYLSVRHTGATIAPNNELNGISLGAVGAGTVMEYVETYASSDDGFEWFGGSVNGKYLISSFCDDDAFDIDQGFRGKLQFIFSIQDSIAANRATNWAGEWDGDDVANATPLGKWSVYNGTFIGGGSTAASGNGAFHIRANGSAMVYNSIISNFKNNRGLVIQDNEDVSIVNDSRVRFEEGSTKFGNNVFWAIGSASRLDSMTYWSNAASNAYTASPAIAESLALWGNTYANPGIAKVAYRNGMLDPTTPTTTWSGLATPPSDGFYSTASFKGAFGTNNWAAYWTALWDEYVLAEPTTTKPEKVLRDSDIDAGEALTLDKDTVYVLSEKVFVEDGAVLTIQAGTVIKGVEERGENAAALIICRGAKIIANGTASEPIIFTAYSDDVNNPDDLDNNNKGLWGGLVILGKGITNEGTDFIEGIAGSDSRASYGGTDNADSSGVLRYVSVRHSGTAIAPNNELNGISLASVGSKTVFDHIEVFASADDGFEWWGGAMVCTHLIAAFCDDDAFDIDQAFAGSLQFVLSIQDSISANNSANWLGEWDGDDVTGATPFAQWTVANATLIGGGTTANSSNAGIIIRANGSAKLYNSIITNVKKDRGIVIEDKQDAQVQDSRMRLESGDIKIAGNLLWNIGGATLLDSVARWYYTSGTSSVYPAAPSLADSLRLWQTQYANPMLAGIGYRRGGGALIPQPASGSPAYADVVAVSDSRIQQVLYKGAFGGTQSDNWATGWSYLDEGGYMGSFVQVGVRQGLAANGSHGASMWVTERKRDIIVRIDLSSARQVKVAFYTLSGKTVQTVRTGKLSAGTHSLKIRRSDLPTGMLMCRAEYEGGSMVQPLSIVR